MRASLLPVNSSASKACNRKQPCLEKIFGQQEKRGRLDPSRKAQSKLYSCIFIFFISIFVFLYCNHLDSPSIGKSSSPASAQGEGVHQSDPTQMDDGSIARQPALRGLGTVYRVGSKAMSELVVAHVSESASPQDFKIFLRTIHRSGVTARADMVFLFPSSSMPQGMEDIIHEEEAFFQRLLNESQHLGSFSEPFLNASRHAAGVALYSNATISSFNMNAFRKSASENESFAQPIWGCCTGNVSRTNTTVVEGPRYKYGSIVGFDVSELNPDDTLQGFIDHPPLQLRRWACYQMLLGMIRHRFKHILLTDVLGGLVLGDPLALARRKAGLYLSLEDRNWGFSLGEDSSVKYETWAWLDEDRTGDAVTRSSQLISSSRQALNNELHEALDGTDEIRSPSHSIHADAQGAKPVAAEKTHKVEILSHFSDHAQNIGLDMLPSGSNGIQLNAQFTSGVRRQLNAQTAARRRSGRKRRNRKSSSAGLYERVYGRRMWSTLEEVEKKKKVVNSGAIVGSVQQIRSLANTMVTEIVKVALERMNREPFPDNVLLSYLLHKSSVLGKKVMDHLHLMENSESFVHSLVGSQQPGLFFMRNRHAYSMVNGESKSKLWSSVLNAVSQDICSSPADAVVYSDCPPSLQLV